MKATTKAATTAKTPKATKASTTALKFGDIVYAYNKPEAKLAQKVLFIATIAGVNLVTDTFGIQAILQLGKCNVITFKYAGAKVPNGFETRDTTNADDYKAHEESKAEVKDLLRKIVSSL